MRVYMSLSQNVLDNEGGKFKSRPSTAPKSTKVPEATHLSDNGVSASDEASVNSTWINWKGRCIYQDLCQVFIPVS